MGKGRASKDFITIKVQVWLDEGNTIERLPDGEAIYRIKWSTQIKALKDYKEPNL